MSNHNADRPAPRIGVILSLVAISVACGGAYLTSSSPTLLGFALIGVGFMVQLVAYLLD